MGSNTPECGGTMLAGLDGLDGGEVGAEVHGPLWKLLSTKMHVSFRDRTVTQCSDC